MLDRHRLVRFRQESAEERPLLAPTEDRGLAVDHDCEWPEQAESRRRTRHS
jgi:hypothetical protein